MSLFYRAGAAVVRWLCTRRDVQGVSVCLHPAQTEHAERVWTKVTEGIELVASIAPRQFARLRRLVDHVLVMDTGSEYGAMWDVRARTIHLEWNTLVRPDVAGFHVGASIVHETTHAWLESLGFAYTPERRQRIEAICTRAEAAFARRFPDGDAAADHYEARAAEVLASGDYWTDRAFRSRGQQAVDRNAARLRDLGVPDILVRALRRSRSRRST